MHIDTLLILSGINLGVGAWVAYRLESAIGQFLRAIENVRTCVQTEASETRAHVTERSANAINQTVQATSVAARETHDRIDALSTHLFTHANDLASQTEQLKAHARAVIDAANQQQPRQSRIVCSKCNRTVYKFTPEGICLDCVSKG